MGRIIFDTATTANGWIADENESLGWLFAVPGPEVAPGEDTTQLAPPEAAIMVMGSSTYRWVLREVDMLAHPERWQEYHGEKPTFVFTHGEAPVPEGADIRFVSGPVTDALPALRAAAGDGDIWVVGGGDLAGQFFDAGALDEIALSIAPVLLPGGAPLFPQRVESDRLTLLSAEAVGAFARLRYRVRS